MNASVVPLYRQVYDSLRGRIGSGEFQPGEALPSEQKLREEFGVSIITVRRAIHELSLDGLVDSRHGIGNIVVDPQQSAVAVGLSSFTSDVASGRLRLVRTLISIDKVPADEEVAARLRVQPYSLVWRYVRLDSEGGAPLSVDEAYVPPALARSITPETAGSPLFMHLWQQGEGLEFIRTHYDIVVEMPSERDQDLLGIGPDVPLLVTKETVFSKQDRPVGLIVTRYRADRGRLTGAVMLVKQKTPTGIIGE